MLCKLLLEHLVGFPRRYGTLFVKRGIGWPRTQGRLGQERITTPRSVVALGLAARRALADDLGDVGIR